MIIVGIRSDRVMSRCKLKYLQAVIKIGAIKGSVCAALTRAGLCPVFTRPSFRLLGLGAFNWPAVNCII